MNHVSTPLRWAGIVLILLTGLIHFIDAPSSFDDATYKGVLFVANGVAAIVAAVGIWQGRRWGWGLGAVVAAGAFVLYIVSRTFGMPGLEPDEWLEPLGVASLVVEALFTGLAVYALTRQAAPEEAPAAATPVREEAPDREMALRR